MGRRGPKTRKNVKREPNGRASRVKGDVQVRQTADRQETERQAMDTVLTARARIYGIPEVLLREQKAATVVGRMRLQEELSEAQYQAAVKYGTIRARYMKSLDCATEATPADDRTGWVEDEDQARRAARSRERWDEAMDAVTEAQQHVRTGNLAAALDYMVIRDEYHEHMEGDVKLALNALARLWELDKTYQEDAA